MTEKLTTKYGNATLNRDGYFKLNGLEWFIVNETIAKQVCDEFGYDLMEVN